MEDCTRTTESPWLPIILFNLLPGILWLPLDILVPRLLVDIDFIAAFLVVDTAICEIAGFFLMCDASSRRLGSDLTAIQLICSLIFYKAATLIYLLLCLVCSI
jgi:hypothetical protein